MQQVLDSEPDKCSLNHTPSKCSCGTAQCAYLTIKSVAIGIFIVEQLIPQQKSVDHLELSPDIDLIMITQSHVSN